MRGRVIEGLLVGLLCTSACSEPAERVPTQPPPDPAADRPAVAEIEPADDEDVPAPPESDTDLGYGKLLVELREGHGADVAERISAEVGGSELQDVGVGGLYIMRLSASSAEETRAIAERVGADPAVASATGEWVTDGAADRSTLEHRRHASRSEP